MKSLSFNDGRQNFMVNNDPAKIIRFNPADPEILNRILETQKKFTSYNLPEDIELNPDGSPKGDLEKGAAYIAEFTSAMRTAFNGIFNSDVYDTIFDGQSPLCIVGQKYLFEEVFEGVLKLMEPAIKEYNKKNEQKMRKYLGDLEE